MSSQHDDDFSKLFSATAGSDDDMNELFDMFDEASTSEATIQRTLAAIAAEREECAQEAHKTKPRRARMMRIIAIAACVAALVVGGVAYAVPVSNVSVTAGDHTVNLGVNAFGITVSAQTSDEEAQSLINEAQVRNMPYDEALSKVIDSLAKPGEESGKPEADANSQVDSADHAAESAPADAANRGIGPTPAPSNDDEPADNRAEPAGSDSSLTDDNPSTREAAPADADANQPPTDADDDNADGAAPPPDRPPIEIRVDASNEQTREQMEQRSAEVLEQKGQMNPPERPEQPGQQKQQGQKQP